MKKLALTFLATALAGMIQTLAQQTAPVDDDIVLFGADAAPDGVQIVALGEDGFKLLSVATAPLRTDSPQAVATATTVAVTKAEGALSRYLNETVETDDFVEKEIAQVRVVSADGSVAASQTISRRVLARIRTESKSLLRGAIVLQTAKTPHADGDTGSLRVVVGVSSSTLVGAEALEAGIDAAR